MTREHNAWQAAADQTSGIEGIHLKCGKGIWTADGTPLETGPDGARFAVIMPTARIGIVRWVDGKPAEMNVGGIEDGFVAPDAPDDSWSQYTETVVSTTNAGGQLALSRVLPGAGVLAFGSSSSHMREQPHFRSARFQPSHAATQTKISIPFSWFQVGLILGTFQALNQRRKSPHRDMP